MTHRVVTYNAGVTFEDILKLPAAVIGALAVLAASAISAFMVMLTALVNTRSARRTARDRFDETCCRGTSSLSRIGSTNRLRYSLAFNECS